MAGFHRDGHICSMYVHIRSYLTLYKSHTVYMCVYTCNMYIGTTHKHLVAMQ